MIAVAMLALSSPVVAQTVISTTGGGAPISPFGKPDAQTFGQTFTTPTDNILQTVTFYLSPAGSLRFRAYVFAWDPILFRVSGSALFTSAPIVGPIGSGFIPISVGTGGLVLNPFLTYVAFFSSSGVSEIGEVALQSSWESPGTNQYPGGAFVYLNNGENTGAWATQAWSTDRQGPGSDVRFTMQFTTVPEPASLLLVTTGGAVVAGFVLRRRKRQRGVEG